MPKTRVVIMQPFYLFLRKHFHLIQKSDVYVFYDDVQFVLHHHHNRNRIKGPNGYIWLTVPVKHTGRSKQLISDVVIDNGVYRKHQRLWQKRQWMAIQQHYSKAPFFSRYYDFFEDCFSHNWTNLCELNIYLIKNLVKFLKIADVRFLRSSELNIYHENPTQRLVNICEHLGATHYMLGARGKSYMEEDRWSRTTIKLEYFEPEYPPYPQLYGEFLDNCSIIDLLFNCGQDSYRYIWGDIFEKFQNMEGKRRIAV